MSELSILTYIKKATHGAQTRGLPDKILETFLASKEHKDLSLALQAAKEAFSQIEKETPEILKLTEKEAIASLQDSLVNFYPEDQVNPYVAIAAKGPWVVTLHGAVLHDSGGYGMLGLGHHPEEILKVINGKQVMANVMTPSLSHKKIAESLQKEVGHRHASDKPLFTKYLYMNSGSESVTVAMKIADLKARTMTDPGGQHEKRAIKLLAHKGGFHGRTDRPAQASDSTLARSVGHLASFRDRKNLWTLEPNDVAGLQKAFADAKAENIYIEMLLLEPVMGEGNPGLAITPDFYKEARRLTKEHGSVFLIDSIQAGFRAHGCLSIMDYPGFENCEPPDCETYSKALNAGQYPLSVLAMTEEMANLYLKGVYGNTMTANPRALDVAAKVLELFTPSLRENIRERGKEMVEEFKKLAQEFPDVVTGVSGTGLLCAIHLKEDGYKVVGRSGVELYMRENGIGVIHGGKNALRFTPHFAITSEEISLIMDEIRKALQRGPCYS